MQRLSIGNRTGEQRIRNARPAYGQVYGLSQAMTREFCGLEA